MGLDNPIHIAFLLIVLLLVFGAKRLPGMGRSLGTGMRGFTDAISGESSAPRALITSSQTSSEPEPTQASTREHAPARVEPREQRLAA